MSNAYLEETQDIVRLVSITRIEAGLTKLGGERDTLPQRPVLNGGGEEGRRADFLP